jgi:hypothetical protein
MTEVRDQAIEVARGWSPPDAPASWRLTAALFGAIADNDRLLERIASLPSDRLPALLAGSAITFLARRKRSAALHAYFPQPGSPQPSFDSGFFSAFDDFCSTSLDEIMAICGERRYQMNEVARCTQIACAIAATVVPPEEPIALVDLGTGAGLGLELDRFCYRIGEQSVGPPESAVQLECDLRGTRSPPLSRLPRIAERVGIDLHPIDVRDAAAREWLVACAPAEESALSRLATAIDVVRRHPPALVEGDVVEAVPGVLEGLPPERTAVVVDSYTAVFLPEDRRRLLATALAEAGRARPVIWLSLDPLVPLGPSGRDSVQGLAIPDDLVADYQQHGVFAVLGARRYHNGSDHGRLLGRGHPSGGWMEWLG